jgi:precorrin-4/cobalt-precorrin-4 C11-methyltransferase
LNSKVYFIGVGPGDPELITVKALKVLKQADVVIYAGSLINPEILKYAKKDAKIYDSAKMDREEIIRVMVEEVKRGKIVARLHPGDPHIYGALKEQQDALKKEGVSYTVIPGVSSFLAAAAALDTELTLPGVSQTIIITRASYRATPVPDSENLESLARHKATLVIFTGIQLIERIVDELLKGGYPPETPVGVVYKASWPEQIVLKGTLQNIVKMVKDARIYRTALIIVGEVVEPKRYELSKLYDPRFTHSYRKARKVEE